MPFNTAFLSGMPWPKPLLPLQVSEVEYPARDAVATNLQNGGMEHISVNQIADTIQFIEILLGLTLGSPERSIARRKSWRRAASSCRWYYGASALNLPLAKWQLSAP
jgi:hypothetical protein